jgi:hypothetical protein
MTGTLNLFNSDATDVLANPIGLPEVLYNTSGSPSRGVAAWALTGFDANTANSARIVGGNMVEVTLGRESGNFLRVLTVPEPTTLVVWSLLGVIGVGVGSRRRRRLARS